MYYIPTSFVSSVISRLSDCIHAKKIVDKKKLVRPEDNDLLRVCVCILLKMGGNSITCTIIEESLDMLNRSTKRER